MSWSVDCDSGNRKMTDICNIEDNPSLIYIVVVTDTVRFGKTYKCCWGNGFRSNDDRAVSDKLHKLLTTEPVRSKDRMAVEPLLPSVTPRNIALIPCRKGLKITLISRKTDSQYARVSWHCSSRQQHSVLVNMSWKWWHPALQRVFTQSQLILRK